ncbi:MAG: integrin alpha, partial [Pseudomonadota bacterium]
GSGNRQDEVPGNEFLVRGVGGADVVFGRADGDFEATIALNTLARDEGLQIAGTQEVTFSGTSVASAGDFNGDGVRDFVVGGPADTEFTFVEGGQVTVVFGANGDSIFDIMPSTATLDAAGQVSNQGVDRGVRFEGFQDGEKAGTSVAGGADVNGDGFDDVIVGAPTFNVGSGADGQDTGAVYIFFGRDPASIVAPETSELRLINDSLGGFDNNTLELDGVEATRIVGEARFSSFGISVDIAGDVNGDGIADIIIGASTADPHGLGPDSTEDGAAYIVFGRRDGFEGEIDVSDLDETEGFRIDGVEGANSGLGGRVAGIGDINRDGVDDLAVQFSSVAGVDGEAHILFGARIITQGPDDLLGTELGEEINGLGGADTID